MEQSSSSSGRPWRVWIHGHGPANFEPERSEREERRLFDYQEHQNWGTWKLPDPFWVLQRIQPALLLPWGGRQQPGLEFCLQQRHLSEQFRNLEQSGQFPAH